MLRNCALIAGLLLFPSPGLSVSAERKEICPVDDAPFNLPTCKNTYESSCSSGDVFINKFAIPQPEAYQQVADIVIAGRKAATIEAQALANRVYKKFHDQRDKIFKSMPDKTVHAWAMYFKLLIDASVKTHSHNLGVGTCGEAAKAAIASSLLKQLTTNTRETVQLIMIDGEPLSFEPSETLLEIDNPNHVFVIFNSKLIPSKELQGNTDLATIMKNLVPHKNTKPVITCDSWVDYHGDPAKWLQHVQEGRDHFYGRVKWKKIQVVDYTIPSMQQTGMTPQQRKFLVELMRDDILRQGVYKLENTKSNHFSNT